MALKSRLPGRTPSQRFRLASRCLAALLVLMVVGLWIGLPAGAPYDRWSLLAAGLVCLALGLFLNLFACPRCGTWYLWKRYAMHVEMHWMPDACRQCGLPSVTPYADVVLDRSLAHPRPPEDPAHQTTGKVTRYDTGNASELRSHDERG